MMATESEKGLIRMFSAHSFDETLARIESILNSQGVKIFAVIDHAGEAASAGLRMPPTKVVIFGNPKAGTPLMIAAPTTAIDLPLKLLVAKDDEGAVWVTYNDPGYLLRRHGFPPELLASVSGIAQLAAKATE